MEGILEPVLNESLFVRGIITSYVIKTASAQLPTLLLGNTLFRA